VSRSGSEGEFSIFYEILMPAVLQNKFTLRTLLYGCDLHIETNPTACRMQNLTNTFDMYIQSFIRCAYIEHSKLPVEKLLSPVKEFHLT
jgi:hypothetical protein